MAIYKLYNMDTFLHCASIKIPYKDDEYRHIKAMKKVLLSRWATISRELSYVE